MVVAAASLCSFQVRACFKNWDTCHPPTGTVRVRVVSTLPSITTQTLVEVAPLSTTTQVSQSKSKEMASAFGRRQSRET